MSASASYLPVLSYVQVVPLLAAHKAGSATAQLSPDLGLTMVEVRLTADGAHFPTGEMLTWDDAAHIVEARNSCFALADGEAREIRTFSNETNWVRSLYPTQGAPTMLVSGFPMHRIKDTDPWKDTETKVRTLVPVVGRLLDTATGLGYTAIVAARTAEEVVTVELDPAGLEIARQNPWSRELFERPNIRQIVGDVADVLPTFADASFARILHDPPTLSLAGHLYGEAFYRELLRVLQRGGRLFHYIGDPNSTSGGRTTTGVMRRLQSAGFRRVVRRPEAFGVLAYV